MLLLIKYYAWCSNYRIIFNKYAKKRISCVECVNLRIEN